MTYIIVAVIVVFIVVYFPRNQFKIMEEQSEEIFNEIILLDSTKVIPPENSIIKKFYSKSNDIDWDLLGVVCLTESQILFYFLERQQYINSAKTFRGYNEDREFKKLEINIEDIIEIDYGFFSTQETINSKTAFVLYFKPKEYYSTANFFKTLLSGDAKFSEDNTRLAIYVKNPELWAQEINKLKIQKSANKS